MFDLNYNDQTIATNQDDPAHAQGAISFDPALSTARVSVPTETPKKFFPITPVWDDNDGYGPDDVETGLGSDDPARQSVADPAQAGDNPNPGGPGGFGNAVDFMGVAPPHNGPQSRAHVGDGGKGHGGFALGAGRPD